MGEFSLVANGVYRALHHFRRGSCSLRVDDSVIALLAYGLLAYGYGLLVYGLLDHYR